jgi:hypothetical protein
MIDSNFDKVAVIHIADRAKYVEKQTYTIDIPGMLYGLMPFSRRFEFQPQVGRWFDGRLADTFDSASVPRELPSKCVGVFFQAKDVHAGKGAKPRWRYELLALKPWEGD